MTAGGPSHERAEEIFLLLSRGHTSIANRYGLRNLRYLHPIGRDQFFAAQMFRSYFPLSDIVVPEPNDRAEINVPRWNGFNAVLYACAVSPQSY
jgi:hypothetical protein